LIFQIKFLLDIKEQVRTIEKAVSSKEPRYILRVLRALATTRKRLNEDVIRRLILFYYGSNLSEREILLGFAQSVSQVCLNKSKFYFSSSSSFSQWMLTWKNQVHLHQLVKNKYYLVLKHQELVQWHYQK
jgi:hypothetical protein